MHVHHQPDRDSRTLRAQVALRDSATIVRNLGFEFIDRETDTLPARLAAAHQQVADARDAADQAAWERMVLDCRTADEMFEELFRLIEEFREPDQGDEPEAHSPDS